MSRLPVLALVMTFFLAACQVGGPDISEPGTPSKAENTAEMVRVVEQARRLESVIDVEGVYDTSFTTFGQTALIATVPEGTPTARSEQLADELMALMWRSRIDPITTMGSSIVLPGGDPRRGSLAGRLIQTDDGFGRLAAELGPRPPA